MPEDKQVTERIADGQSSDETVCEATRSEAEHSALDTSRRTLLAGIAGMLAAAVADLLPRRASAQTGQPTPMLLEAPNLTTSPTSIEYQSVPGFEDSALRVAATKNAGIGLATASEWGAGLVGTSGPSAQHPTASTTLALTVNPVGVVGIAESVGTGVRGVSGPLATSVTASSTTNVGVLGASDGAGAGLVGISGPQALGVTVSSTIDRVATGTGVVGLSDYGVGMLGVSGPPALFGTASSTLPVTAGVAGGSDSGAGVHGSALAAVGAGVVAENAFGGLALDVRGRVRLATSGCGNLTIKSKTHQVNDPRVAAESVVFVTFLAEPRPKGLRVTHVDVLPGVGFVINLKGKPRIDVPFAYVVIDRTPLC